MAAKSTGRIPGLDGLRAISILLVLAGHLAGMRHCFTMAALQPLRELANLGVRVFFVISGFLITSLLLDEQLKSGTMVIAKAATGLGRMLNSLPFVFLGQLSYSLYLWQQPFLNRQSASWIAAFPVNLLFALGAALVCHYFVELPFLSLRDRWQKPKGKRGTPAQGSTAAANSTQSCS